jgi:Mg-chelatase subunit ChlD
MYTRSNDALSSPTPVHRPVTRYASLTLLLAITALAITTGAIAQQLPIAPPVSPPALDWQLQLQTAADLDRPYLSEVAPISGTTQPAWVEIAIDGQYRIYLPLILNNAASSLASDMHQPQATSAIPGLELSGYQVSDEDGNNYTIPAALPPVPLDARVLIIFDGQGAGVDDYDFSDGVATLHSPIGMVGVFESNGDQVALYNSSTHSANTIIDFVAWGQTPGADQNNAVTAGLWLSGTFMLYDQGFGNGVANSPPGPDDSIGVWHNRDGQGPLDWTAYYAPNSSPGEPNPPSAPLHSTIADGAELAGETFGMAWTPTPDAVNYEFQLAISSTFTAPLFNVVTTYPSWQPDSPLADGAYYWRVRAIDSHGDYSGYLGPLQVTSTLLGLSTTHGPSAQVTLLTDAQYRLQRKDTTMLDIGGGPNNSMGNGSSNVPGDTYNRWDLPHTDASNNPAFSWNGMDNWYCVRASTAMMVLYYGGNLSEDRISYHLFEEWSSASNQIGIPENDLGWSTGVGSYSGHEESLSWALGTPLTGTSWCPEPSDPDYTCNTGGSDPIDFATVQGFIDADRPFMSTNLNNAHMRVIDGYWIKADNTKWIHVMDPVPLSGCGGICSGARWESFSTFQDDNERTYPGPASAPSVRSDELSISIDSDGDGVNDFDETERFNTDPLKTDTDYDWVDDKQDIAETIFDSAGTYNPKSQGPDKDGDGKRKELDWDNDADGAPDGCEDVNGNGIMDVGDTNNFSSGSKQNCVPRFFIVAPTSSLQANAGDHTNPDKVLMRISMELPLALPNPPVFTSNQFSATIGGLPAPNISGAPVGEEFWLLVQAPVQPAASFYSVTVVFSGTNTDQKDNAVYYIPRPRMDTLLVIDVSGSMADYNKLGSAKNAARLYADQWTVNDRLGLVTFSDTAKVRSPLTTINSNLQQITTVKNLINALTPYGATAMGSGLLSGEQQLDATGGITDDWSMMLLTDGQENVSPYWNDASVSNVIIPKKTIVNTIGLGPADANWFGTLQQIAGATNGVFGAVYDPSAALNAPEAPSAFPTALPNQLADSYKYAAEQILHEQRLFEAAGTLVRSITHSYTITIASALPSLLFAANFDLANQGDLLVYRPNGTLVKPTDLNVQHRSDPTHEQFRISNPAMGNWHIVLKNTAGTGTIEYVAFASGHSPLTMNFIVGPLNNGKARLIVLLADYKPVKNANVVVNVMQPNGTMGTSITLFDDGAHGDGLANDGIYGGQITPSLIGTYILKAKATGLDNYSHSFVRYAQGTLINQRPAAFVYSNTLDLLAYTDYKALLAFSSIPLVGVPISNVATTNWGDYELVLIGAYTGLDREWVASVAITPLQNSRLPIIGLGRGGYAFFGRLGLDIGYANGVYQNITRTVPFSPTATVWSLPFPLIGATPYQIYGATAGVSIYVSASPPANLERIGHVPGSSVYYNIVRQATRYLLWGFQARPSFMTTNGRKLFLNVVDMMLH